MPSGNGGNIGGGTPALGIKPAFIIARSPLSIGNCFGSGHLNVEKSFTES